jgi:hypothetical protein
MRTVIKKATMLAHNHGFLSAGAVVRIFARFSLWSA